MPGIRLGVSRYVRMDSSGDDDDQMATWTPREWRAWMCSLVTGFTLLFVTRSALPFTIVEMAKEFDWDKRTSVKNRRRLDASKELRYYLGSCAIGLLLGLFSRANTEWSTRRSLGRRNRSSLRRSRIGSNDTKRTDSGATNGSTRSRPPSLYIGNLSRSEIIDLWTQDTVI